MTRVVLRPRAVELANHLRWVFLLLTGLACKLQTEKGGDKTHNLGAYVESWNNVARVYDQQHSNQNTKFYASSLKNGSKSESKKFSEKKLFQLQRGRKNLVFQLA